MSCNKIMNPKTRKKVNLNSKSGRQVINQYGSDIRNPLENSLTLGDLEETANDTINQELQKLRKENIALNEQLAVNSVKYELESEKYYRPIIEALETEIKNLQKEIYRLYELEKRVDAV